MLLNGGRIVQEILIYKGGFKGIINMKSRQPSLQQNDPSKKREELMIDETIRSELYDQLEKKYPLRHAGKQEKQMDMLGLKEESVDLSVRWQREAFALKEQLLADVLFQLHTMFHFPVEDAEVKRQSREALKNLFDLDGTCRANGECDVQDYTTYLFRKQWYAASLHHPFLDAPQKTDANQGSFSASLLSSLQHLERASFFQKNLQEIADWTKRFLLIERYHRLDALEHENRLDRYRLLRSQSVSQPKLIRNLEDLIIWLEFRMFEQSGLSDESAGPLSHQLAQELEGHIAPELLADEPLQPALYVLLRCHQYCLAETLNEVERNRLEKLYATRQLDSLLDLMRVVVNRTMGEHSVPEAGTVLDRLQSEGFNIEHQGFRDPYEASLVSLEEVERLEKTSLPLFLPLESLTGHLEHDLAFSREMLVDWHNRIIKEIVSECESYVQASAQPLPKNHLISRLVRFAAGWTIAGLPWFPPKQPDKFGEDVRETLPDNVIRPLVRPRKGYELKSRNELKELIDREVQSQWDALQRIVRSRRIQGYHDYTQFTRYIAFQYLRDSGANDLTSKLQHATPIMSKLITPEWVADAGRKWGLNISQVHPHALESVEHYCRAIIPFHHILPPLQQHFETTENDLQEVYSSVVSEFSSAFYTLLVGYGRHREELPRIAADEDQIAQMVSLLTPPLETVHTVTLGSLKEELSSYGAPLYRSSLRPYLLSTSEWRAYLAWETHQRLGNDIHGFLDDGDLDAFLTELEDVVAKVDLPPHTLAHQTLKSTLISLLKPEETASEISEEMLGEIVQLLPQLDCAACGQASCRQFARALLTGRTQPQHCVQLPKHSVSPLIGRLRQLRDIAGNGSQPGNLLEVLSDHTKWQSSEESRVFRKVLSNQSQKARHLLMTQLEEIWENLAVKPQIFKSPNLTEFHESLRDHMGSEAVERLRDDERTHLIEHGDERLKAEWLSLKERQSWLNLVNRKRQSRPLLQRKDPSWVAADIYKNVFFLHQLSSRDRSLVLQYRWKTHEDEFSYWWNEDLLTMNLPDFFIRDWEDFSKIIKNAYWHQESSLSAGKLLSTLKNEVLLEESSARIRNALLAHWLDSEIAGMEKRRLKLSRFREHPDKNLIRDVAELREIIFAVVDESKLAGTMGEEHTMALFSLPISTEEQLILAGDRIWKRFQDEHFRFSIDFACLWDHLSRDEKDTLQGLHGTSGDVKALSAGGDSPWYLKSWQEPLQKRVALIRALIVSSIKQRYREELECRWFDQILRNSPKGVKGSETSAKPSEPHHIREQNQSEIPSSYFRLMIRRGLRDGKNREQINEQLRELLASNPPLNDRLIEDALYRMILACQHGSLLRAGRLPVFSQDQRLSLGDSPQGHVVSLSKENEKGLPSKEKEREALLKQLPELKSIIDLLLERHKAMDRERLLHYLFLLAKMEGNLDSLTALLREIRETSDIMEAAWLRFTQERILEGPGQKNLPGTSLGIPLLASRIKDKDAINRGLREGVSRKEKRNVAAAVNELTNFIRFHVLLNMERSGSVQNLIGDFQNSGYDLSGIDKDALELAIQRQWERRDQLLEQRIWIYTTVTARRLAAQDNELQEAEREFYGIRSEILKGEASGNDHYHEIASRRGVALGRIKEELYRQLSDLLEKERIATFQKRIEQIVDQLDKKRQEIYHGWSNGLINRRTVFYTLRQYQKNDADPSWSDFQCFLRDHWFTPIEELRSSERPDRNERIGELDHRFEALLGVSLLELEAEAEQMADKGFAEWMAGQVATLESRLI